jgi:hypothetical protein
MEGDFHLSVEELNGLLFQIFGRRPADGTKKSRSKKTEKTDEKPAAKQ